MFDVVKIKASQASLYQIFDDSKPGICVSDFYLGGNGMTYAAVIDKPQRIAQNLSAALPCQRKILIDTDLGGDDTPEIGGDAVLNTRLLAKRFSFAAGTT